jgi:hypothetical protein
VKDLQRTRYWSKGRYSSHKVNKFSPRLINFPVKRKFRERARNFSRQKLLPKKASAMVAVPNLARTPQFCNRGQVTINSSVGHVIVVPSNKRITIAPAS